MGSRAFWLMLVVDLLTTASKPFQWLVVEADWFVASTGFQEQADIESYLSQFGFERLCSQLSDSLGPDPPVGARGGPDLVASFRQGWPLHIHAGPRPSLAAAQLPAARPAPAMGLRPSAPAVPGARPADAAAPWRRDPAPPRALPQPPRRPVQGVKRPLQVGHVEVSAPDPHTHRQKLASSIAADPAGLSEAVEDLRSAFFASATVGAHRSQLKLYLSVCKSAGLEPFPMSHKSLENLAASMLKAGYRQSSIPQYLSAVVRQQKLLWIPIPDELRDYKAIVARAVLRYSGDAHRMEPFTKEMLIRFRDLELCTGTKNTQLFRILTIAWFFVLRADESVGSDEFRGISAEDFHFNDMAKQVTLTLGVTKTNSAGNLCKRTLACCCPRDRPLTTVEKVLPLCPFCAAKRLVEDDQIACSQGAPLTRKALHALSKGMSLEELQARLPLRPRDGSAPPCSSKLLAFMRKGLGLLGIKTLEDGKQLFGTHSLRRGAAQALCAAGWSLDQIRFFGRWLSDCVELYLLSAPSQYFGDDVSASMLGMAHRLVEGVGAGVSQGAVARKAPDLSKPAHALRKPTLQAGTRLYAYLPDLCQPLEDEDVPLDDLDSGVGYLEVTVVSMLPSLPPSTADSLSDPSAVYFHSSIQTQFPRDFQILLRRKSSDRCALIQVAPELSLVAVCFNSVPFYISQT